MLYIKQYYNPTVKWNVSKNVLYEHIHFILESLLNFTWIDGKVLQRIHLRTDESMLLKLELCVLNIDEEVNILGRKVPYDENANNERKQNRFLYEIPIGFD